MDTVTAGQAPKNAAIDRDGTLLLAVLLIVPVIVFDQFLRTSPSALSGSLGDELMYCASDTLLGLPFAAAAVWAGNRIVDRWRFRSRSAWGVFVRAGVIALGVAIFLIPGWFLHDPSDKLAHATAVVSGGPAGHDEAHWASDGVFYALILVPVFSATVWGGDRIGRRLWRGQDGGSSLSVRLGVIAALLALALPAAWFLQQGADRAHSGGVTYGAGYSDQRPLPMVMVPNSHGQLARGHLTLLRPARATPLVTQAVYDFSRALRDGLAGQAVGLPVIFLVLLWRTRRRPLGSTPSWGNT